MTDPPETRKSVHGLHRYAALGTQFGLTVLICCGLGYLADRNFGTTPYGLITGLFFGAVGGVYSLYRAVEALGKPRGKEKSD